MKHLIPNIRYRAKKLGTNDWIYGYAIIEANKWTDKTLMLLTIFPNEDVCAINPETSCRNLEYAIRTDGNQLVEMFDKDIIQFTTHAGNVYRYLIQWVDEGQEWQAIPLADNTKLVDAAYYFYSVNHTSDWPTFMLLLQDLYGDIKKTEVIGNAFDNYDMLNVDFDVSSCANAGGGEL